MKQLIKTRMAMAKDLGRILDLDIKCQEYPDNLEVLKLYTTEPSRVAFVAAIGQRDVGYALCTKLREEATGGDAFFVVVGVHPDFRNIGVSKSLMCVVSNRALQEKCHTITFVVPSYKIDDIHDPDYLGWWFESMELKAGRVWTDFFYRYGKNWDAYVFEALV